MSNSRKLKNKLKDIKNTLDKSLPAAKGNDNDKNIDNELEINAKKIEDNGLEVRNRLTTKQIIFCKEYIKDNNGARAARAAGYSEDGAAVQASRNLKRPEVQAEIERNRLYSYSENEENIKNIKMELYRILNEARNDPENDNYIIQLKVIDMLAKMNNAYISTQININEEVQPLYPDIDYDDVEEIEEIEEDDDE